MRCYEVKFAGMSASTMLTQPKISLDEERLQNLSKRYLKRNLKKQEVIITKIINSNFTLTIIEIKGLTET